MFRRMTNKQLQDALFERIQGLHTYVSLIDVTTKALLELKLRDSDMSVSIREDGENLYYSVSVEGTVGIFWFKRRLNTRISRNYRIGCGAMEV